MYQENTSANDHTLTLLKEELRPENVKLRVKPTNRAIYQLKHGAMGAIRVQDKALQVAQEPLAKAMYRTMRVAEGITSDKMDPSSAVDHCMDIVAMATNALHQIDQGRRELYKPVLPSSLKDLISCPLGDNAELFGDNLKDRQKEIIASNELSHSLAEKPATATYGRPPQYGRRVYPKPYACLPTPWNKYPPIAPVATTTSQGYRPSKNAYSLPRRRPAGGGGGGGGQQTAGMQLTLVSIIPSPPITSGKAGNVKHCLQAWGAITSDLSILAIIAFGVILDFIGLPSENSPTVTVFPSVTLPGIAEELLNLGQNEVFIPTIWESGSFISPIFTTKKSD